MGRRFPPYPLPSSLPHQHHLGSWQPPQPQGPVLTPRHTLLFLLPHPSSPPQSDPKNVLAELTFEISTLRRAPLTRLRPKLPTSGHWKLCGASVGITDLGSQGQTEAELGGGGETPARGSLDLLTCVCVRVSLWTIVSHRTCICICLRVYPCACVSACPGVLNQWVCACLLCRPVHGSILVL